MNPSDLHTWLSTKVGAMLSWASAVLGLGTFMGLVNTLVGVMSAVYLALQLWNYFTHTRPKNKLEMIILNRKVANGGLDSTEESK
jgi:hypothetical protein